MKPGREMPESVALYLRAATCLLPPRTARQIRAELYGNLHQDMLDARCGGKEDAQAWQDALGKAGPAWKTALGLARVHTLGLAVRTLLIGGVLGGATLAVQSGSLTRPPVQSQGSPP